MAAITDCEHLVQYYETDQMGVVHHSNYIRWFEEARTQLFEELGLGYKGMVLFDSSRRPVSFQASRLEWDGA